MCISMSGESGIWRGGSEGEFVEGEKRGMCRQKDRV